jgi:hypothetical protein
MTLKFCFYVTYGKDSDSAQYYKHDITTPTWIEGIGKNCFISIPLCCFAGDHGIPLYCKLLLKYNAKNRRESTTYQLALAIELISTHFLSCQRVFEGIIM